MRFTKIRGPFWGGLYNRDNRDYSIWGSLLMGMAMFAGKVMGELRP